MASGPVEANATKRRRTQAIFVREAIKGAADQLI
jgi:hypothetical protein